MKQKKMNDLIQFGKEKLLRSIMTKIIVCMLFLLFTTTLCNHAHAETVKGKSSIYVLDVEYEEYISIPDNIPQSYQISGTGLSGTLSYEVVDGASVNVSSTGLVTPNVTIMYWNGSYWSSVSTGAEDEISEPMYFTGTSRIAVTNGSKTVYYDITVVDYAQYYAESVMDAYLKKNVTDSMTEYEKAIAICEFVASYNYSVDESYYTGMIVTGGGDCWACSYTIIYMLEKEGIAAHLRYAVNDSGAGSGHRNVAAILDGEIYVIEAGINETPPRYYEIWELPTGFTLGWTSDHTYCIRQYDGFDTDVVIPSTIDGIEVTAINDYAFYYSVACSGVEINSITLPDTITEIGEAAFFGLEEIETFTIPKSVVSIGARAFSDMPSLTAILVSSENSYYKSVNGVLFSKDGTELVAFPSGKSGAYVIPDGVESISEYAFYYASGLTKVTFGEDVKSICEGAFGACGSLTSIVLNDGLEEIEGFAFANTAVEQLILPIGLKKLDEYAFCYAYSLDTVIFTGNAPSIDEEAFWNRTVTAYYPSDKSGWTSSVLQDYGGTVTWKSYKSTATLSSGVVTSLTNTTTGILVKWSRITDATGYYIYRKVSGGSYTLIKTITSGSTVSYTDTSSSLVGGTSYTYKVVPYFENILGTKITGGSKTTKTIKYLIAGEVTGLTNTTSGITVKWAKVTGANGYYVYRKTSGNGDYEVVKTITSGSTTSWSDTSSSLKSGTSYIYKVAPYFKNSSGVITPGAQKTTKTIKYLAAGKVSSLANTASGVYIKWSKVTGATGYYVYRKSSSGSYTLVTTITGVGTTTYSDTAVKSSNNVTYIYYIQPYFKNSSGAITKAAYSTKTIVRLVAPTISSLTNSSSKTMTVKWGTKSGVTGYQVQYSASSSFASGNKTLTLTGASTSSKVISGLTKGKTYYVRIRTYKTVNGVTYYSAWTTKKSVKISK